MSTDETISKELIETLEDGKEGFARAAEKLDGSDRADLAGQFRQFSTERGQFADELRTMAAQYGDTIKESGTATAALHRGWMTVKDALTGSADPKGVLDVAEQGEDHAMSEYKKALAKDDLSTDLRSVIERQFTSVKRAHDTVRSLRDTARA